MYTTEDEQLEQIRRWWGVYGRWISAGVIIALIGFGGWKGWVYYHAREAKRASAIYSSLQQAESAGNSKSAKKSAQTLIDQYAGTPYAALAALALAKQAVSANDLAAAATRLQWVVDHGSQRSLRVLAALRLAQVRIAQKRPDAALALLKTGFGESYMPLVKETEGDAWLAKGNTSRARAAYEQALAGARIAGLPTNTLQMKLAALGPAAQGEAK